MSIKGLELYSVENFEHMKNVASCIWQSGQVQKPWITNAQTVLLVMQRGYDLGMSPIAALDTLTKFRGEGNWGITIAGSKALVCAKGGTIEVKSETDTEVVIVVTRPQWKDHTEKVTMEECSKSGLTTKDVWKKYPKAMLRATAIRRALTHVWSDVLVGCQPFDPELEQEDNISSNEPIVATTDDNKPRRVRRTKAELEAAALAQEGSLPNDEASSPTTSIPKEETQPTAPQDKSSSAPVDPDTGNQGIELTSEVEPVISPEVVEAEEQDNPFAQIRAVKEEPKVELFQMTNQAHRMILIDAVKQSGLDPNGIKKCREAFAGNVYPDRHKVRADFESVKQALINCAAGK